MYVIVVIVALLVGLALAPAVSSVAPDDEPTEPSVAVLTLRGGTSAENVNPVIEDLRELRANESVEAVALRINSPGGPIHPTEELYLAVNRTAQEMPVVAYVEGLAASGGYYGIAPADAIYVKGTSEIGSVGVVVQAPLSAVEDAALQTGTYLRTGPDKAQIGKDQIRQDLERFQSSFVGSVMRHRADELTMGREGVSQGAVYLGSQAVQNGFADEIGDLYSAIERAASLSDAIDGDQYDVFYKEEQTVALNIPIRGGGSVRVGSDGASIESGGAPGSAGASDSEFVRPVRYYAVWGIPASDANASSAGVVADG